MKDIIIQIGNVAFVKVSENNNSDFTISNHNSSSALYWTYKGIHRVKLPQGDWQILGRALELTDEQKELAIKANKSESDIPNLKIDIVDTYNYILERNNITNNYVVILNKTA